MKKNLVFLLILIMTVIFTQSGRNVSAASIDAASPSSTIDTSATSQVEVAPDVAYINANISIIDVVKSVTYNTTKASLNNLINTLTGNGIPKTDIKTTSFYSSAYIDRVVVDPKAVNPVYKDVKKYQTSASIKITVKNIETVGDVLDKILGVDNVDVSNVTYGVNDITKYKQQAIKQAVDMAKENLTFASTSANVSLDKLQSMTVDFNNNPYPIYNMYSKSMASADAAAPIYQNPENIKISATVHMIYTTK
jgi:uncharacterized protein YggE